MVTQTSCFLSNWWRDAWRLASLPCVLFVSPARRTKSPPRMDCLLLYRFFSFPPRVDTTNAGSTNSLFLSPLKFDLSSLVPPEKESDDCVCDNFLRAPLSTNANNLKELSMYCRYVKNTKIKLEYTETLLLRENDVENGAKSPTQSRNFHYHGWSSHCWPDCSKLPGKQHEPSHGKSRQSSSRENRYSSLPTPFLESNKIWNMVTIQSCFVPIPLLETFSFSWKSKTFAGHPRKNSWILATAVPHADW